MNLRYERKYRIEDFSLEEVVAIIRTHPMGFTTLFPDRQVNNIYLDTPDLRFFRENLAGVSERKKYRIRWYGTDRSVMRDPVLEIKGKDSELGYKIQTRLGEDLPLGSLQELRDYIRRNVQSALPLEPVLLNSYSRSYLSTLDKRFRVTIDRELRFHSMEFTVSVPQFLPLDPAIVLEVKYDQADDELWSEFSRGLPFRVSKNSKYVNGVLMTVNPC